MEELRSRKAQLEKEIARLYEERKEIERHLGRKSANPDANLGEMVGSALANTAGEFPQHANVACQGVEGAYSQIAAEKIFRYPGIMYFKNFDGVFSAIESGFCEYGILPIENSTAGSVNRIYDLMRSHRFYIVRSARVKIDHSLLANPGTKLSDIHEIYSHEQAIEQCSDFLDTLKDVKITACSNTAYAAKMVAESGRTDVAALSSENCAALYGLQVIDSHVQNKGNNYTRFICISREPEIYPGADRTSIMATLPHRPGSLCQLLSAIGEQGYNMVKLESRPLPDKDFEFMFYVDFEASVHSENYVKDLENLERVCETFEYLGSYSELL